MGARILAAILALSALTAGALSAAQAPAESEIRQLLHVWDEAYRQRNAQALSRILADDFTIVDAAGTVLNKTSYLMSIVKTPEGRQPPAVASEDVRVAIDGDRATVTGRSPVKGRPRGRAQVFSGDYQFTDTWVKTNGAWQATSTRAERLTGR